MGILVKIDLECGKKLLFDYAQFYQPDDDNDHRNPEKQQELRELLSYSPLLRQVHAWKEALGEWYDRSPDAKVAAI